MAKKRQYQIDRIKHKKKESNLKEEEKKSHT
jgi:hypothetical protein